MLESWGASRPSHDNRFGPRGSTSHGLASKNTSPMKIGEIPGGARRMALAPRLGLRAYQERGLDESASVGSRGSRPASTRSWFSAQVTARQGGSKRGGESADRT